MLEIATTAVKEVAEVASKQVLSEAGKLPDKLGKTSEVKDIPDKMSKGKETGPDLANFEQKALEQQKPIDVQEKNVVGKENQEPVKQAAQPDTHDVQDSACSPEKSESVEFDSLDSMKRTLGKTYKEIKEDKPPNSPNIAKWFENGGTIKVEQVDGKSVWTYTDSEGRSVQYVDGKIKFPPEAKHPVIGDISIGEFTGDRQKDKSLYLDKLEEEYGLTEIPEGYRLHHDTENGVLQLIKEDYHSEFTHLGGHSAHKSREAG